LLFGWRSLPLGEAPDTTSEEKVRERDASADTHKQPEESVVCAVHFCVASDDEADYDPDEATDKAEQDATRYAAHTPILGRRA
jgi:hypothetical protein